jgi:hypothetical protein
VKWQHEWSESVTDITLQSSDVTLFHTMQNLIIYNA